MKNGKFMMVFVIVCILMGIMKSETYGQNKQIKNISGKFLNKIAEKRKMYIDKELSKKNYVLNGVNIIYKDEKLDIKTVQVLNRVYVPLKETCKILNVLCNISPNVIYVDECKINMNGKFWVDKKKNRTNLRGQILDIDGQTYIGLIDLCEILNLKTSWLQKEKKIVLYDNEDVKINNINLKLNSKGTEDGFIRLEDVTAGDVYLKEGNLEKLRIMGDLLKNNNIPYHIAWVPRYVYPEKGIDNNLLEANNFVNAEFIYTLDYLINRGAVVGLHGYTHQYGNTESVIGSEFEKKNNLTLEECRKKVEQAIYTANMLNISFKFFETPHYRSSEEFQTMLEEYFDYIYEPCIGKWNEQPYLSERNKKTLYVPAPLSYVKDEDVDSLFERLQQGRGSKLVSFFYHPSKEFKYINIMNSDKGVVYNYGDSPIKKIIQRFNREGIKFNYINKINMVK